jgi:tRNA threonylcarbamoyladenosine biosynthesis protein TsaB
MTGPVLAIDSSTDNASIAVYGCNGVEVELTWRSGRNQTVQVLPHVAFALGTANLAVRELSAIVVATGPGSFNGVRVGMSIGKGLAFALEIPILGVPTLEALIHQCTNPVASTWAALEIGRGRLAGTQYRLVEGAWTRVLPYLNLSIDELCDHIQEGSTVWCEASQEIRQALASRLAGSATVASPSNSVRRAANLAEIGWLRLLKGEADEIESLQPIYPAAGGEDGSHSQ